MLTTIHTDVITAPLRNACLFNKYSVLFTFFVELLDHKDSLLQASQVMTLCTLQRAIHIRKEKIIHVCFID